MSGRRGRTARLAAFLVLSLAASSPLAARADTAVGATYIVTFDAPPGAEQLEVLSGVALGVHGFRHLPAAVVTALPADAGILANLPGVRRVYPNAALRTMLRQSTRTIGADAVWNDLGYTGSGIGIAVIDAGIDGTHPDLCARPEFCRGTPVKTVQNVKIIGRQSVAEPVVLVEDQITTDSSSGHGTHVAGIAAGLGVASVHEPGRYRGVAPGADLIGLGTGELLEVDTVLAGFDWVIEHRDEYNIKVVNNSWGPGAGHPYDPEEPVQRAIAAAYDAGLSVVFGAGNDGPTTDSLNAFSVNPKAISVAAGTKAGHLAGIFSARGVPGSDLWHPTVTAPGYLIASARASTGFYADVGDANAPNPDAIEPPDNVYYATGNGTSMAAPHVSGVIALMQQASFQARGRYLTPGEVREVLQRTAVSRDPARGPGGLPAYQAYSMGAGYVDARAAAEAAATGSLEAYDDGVAYDVRTFAGDIGPAALIATQSLTSTFAVHPGAISLDVMADWGVLANDVDVDLYAPSGALAASTFLVCSAQEGPNQYSSFCTEKPSERITVASPAAGEWRAVVHGTLSATDAVTGLWSAAYPSGTSLPPGPDPATVTVSAATTTSVQGQPVELVATVRDAAGNVLPNRAVTWSSAGAGRLSRWESISGADGEAAAAAVSDVPGMQTITASAGAATGRASITWLGVALPGPASTPGRASGGGWFSDPGKRTFGFWAEFRTGWSGPDGELSYNDHAGTKVAAAGVDQLVISGSGATVTGPATVNGGAGYRYRLEVADNGPGRSDTFRLEVTATLNPLYGYSSDGTLGGGNISVASG